MERVAIVAWFVIMLLASLACTPIPESYREATTQPITRVYAETESNHNRAILELVATARIGASQLYANPRSGLTSTIRVNSEYFSANGRVCRRYSQHYSNAAEPQNKLACRAVNAWQEIPLASIVD